MKKFLVIGNPIDHSLSPKLHNYWINQNNIKATYEKLKLDESDLNNLNSDSDLTSKTVNNEQTTYIFASSDFKRLQDLEISVRSNEMVISVQLNR